MRRGGRTLLTRLFTSGQQHPNRAQIAAASIDAVEMGFLRALRHGWGSWTARSLPWDRLPGSLTPKRCASYASSALQQTGPLQQFRHVTNL
jgi:hypothetical protein